MRNRPVSFAGICPFVLPLRTNTFSDADECYNKKSKMWNLWHGCHKLSQGCKHCYVYRGDAKRNIDSSVVTQTKSFDLPIQKSVTANTRFLRERMYTPVLPPISLSRMPTVGALRHGNDAGTE